MKADNAVEKRLTQSMCSLYFVFVGILFVFIFLMVLLTPHVGDDLKYTLAYNSFLQRDEPFPGFDGWLEQVRLHYLTINGRFGDKLLVGYLLLPQAIQALLGALGAVATVFFGCRLAFGNIRSHPFLCIAFLLAFVFLMPWYNTMFVGCMVLNYIIGAGIIIPVMWMFFRPEVEGINCNLPKGIGLLVAGFLAGSWHEGFTFIAAPGILISLFMFRRLTKTQWWILSGLILGAIFIVSNPGFWNRFNNKMGSLSASTIMQLVNVSNIALTILVITPVVLCLKKIRKKYSISDLALMVTGFLALIANAVIFLSSLSFPRVMWYGNLLAFIALGCVLKKIHIPRRLFGYMVGLMWAGLLFCLVHFIMSVVWQIKLNKEFQEVIALYKKSDNGQVFYTLKAAETVPWITLGRTSELQFDSWRIDKWIPEFYRPDSANLHLVPKELEEFVPADAKLVGTEDSIYLFKGRVVADTRKYNPARARKIEVTYHGSSPLTYSKIVHNFRGKDGRVYEYWPFTSTESIKTVRLPKKK